MAVYFITGKLGSGKSLAALDKIRERLSDGRRVATNLDLYLDEMFTFCKSTATRLPDKPRAEDMIALGDGYETEDPRDYDEKKFGLIVLDECGTWLNTREWNDKERRKLLDWFLHARKHRWDVMFLIQDVESCDAQLVRSLCEHLVVCRRMDRFKIARIALPRMHIANVYYGRSTEVRVERWSYRGNDLFKAYDTRQVFKDDVDFTDAGPVDMRASYTMLSAWHLKGRYQPEPAPDVPLTKRFGLFWLRMAARFTLGPVLCLWALIDPHGFERTAFRRRFLEQQTNQLKAKRAERAELLKVALDPGQYPPVTVVASALKKVA
ncbi:TPA: hypothetical protein QDZ42_004016 [Stenotrophomonas maltophilia]|nr:hypothetical protein [Stenotrophomonas maltophilia]